MIVAGIGLRPGCGAEEIARLVELAAERAGCRPERLAIPEFRAAEPGPIAAAGALSLGLIVVGERALADAQPRCATRSALAEAMTGVASVAEGCALAAAGPDAVLLLPRISSANATCAIAGWRALP